MYNDAKKINNSNHKYKYKNFHVFIIYFSYFLGIDFYCKNAKNNRSSLKHIDREIERKRDRETQTYTYTYSKREKERERNRQKDRYRQRYIE